jgi:hypothetical protein
MRIYSHLKNQIEAIARFESLVHLPEKWGDKWLARAVKDGHGVNGEGETDLAAMEDLLKKLEGGAGA